MKVMQLITSTTTDNKNKFEKTLMMIFVCFIWLQSLYTCIVVDCGNVKTHTYMYIHLRLKKMADPLNLCRYKVTAVACLMAFKKTENRKSGICFYSAFCIT